jgi:hypothetical protein
MKNNLILFLGTMFLWMIIISMNSSCTEYGDLGSDYITDDSDGINMKELEATASKFEEVFKKADTAGLASILSEASLGRLRPYFAALKSHMPDIGTAFAERKFLYGTERYAVYEYSYQDKKLTVEFCLGNEDNWLLATF